MSPDEMRKLAERAKKFAALARQAVEDKHYEKPAPSGGYEFAYGFMSVMAIQVSTECDAVSTALLDLLAENERLRSENAYLRTNGTELAP